MSSKSSKYSPHQNYVRKVEKLQRAGLIGPVDTRKRPTPYILGQLTRYKEVIAGRATVVKAPSAAKARELRKRLGVKGSGRAVVVPREPGEKIRIDKEGVIKSTRKRYGQTIKKTIGDRSSIQRPTDNVKRYYTLPHRRRGTRNLKRTTFASFDEMLFYLEKYEIDFEEIEDYIEVEEFKKGSRKEKQARQKYDADREKAYKRWKRAHPKKPRKPKRRGKRTTRGR
jgi:hypothetical protein